jgi:hypothetical protein
MRYSLNVYWLGFVYIDLRFYTAWVETGRWMVGLGPVAHVHDKGVFQY